ncbi:MAG: outer membrane protein assembly factor BamA [Candidatus Zixiibacteriota bacterium]|nr:MAG: outer membrane protein assembly factor BamA [candidate division Zixibacteria bacterium]
MITGARIALITVVLVLIGVNTVTAQNDRAVVDVEVSGNRISTTSLILGVSSIAKGSPLTPTIIQNTIRRLYGLGIFSDVHLEAEEISGGLKVYIIVKELPKLTGLEFTGNKKIKSKNLKEEIGLGVGGYISPFLIHKTAQTVRDAYAKKGYFQAEVSSELTYNSDSTEASLKYKITENSKVKVERVVLTGNVRVKANDLIKKMRNRKRGFLKSSNFAQDKYQEDLDKVIGEYHKKGYVDAFLISDSTVIDSATNRMTVYLDVYEGPKYYFGETKFVGAEVHSEETLTRTLKYKQGGTFNTEKYNESVYEIYTAYQDIGHLHIRVLDEKKTRADSLIDITYTITEGLPSHINLVRIIGNTKTKEKVIRREMPVRPGQVFNRSLLIRSIREVMALNFFANVEPVPIDLPNGDVDIEFKVEEKQTGQVSAGAGYNSQDKLVGSFGMGIPNFRGNGQNLSFNTDFGKRRNSFSISFTEPWFFGRPTLFGADLFILNRRWFDDYTEARQGGSIRFGRRLRWPDNYFRAYASYRLERNRFHDYDEGFETRNSASTNHLFRWTEIEEYVDDAGDTTLQIVHKSKDSLFVGEPLPGTIVAYNEEWHTASKLSLTIARDSRNLPEFATKGSQISYTFENTGGLFGGFWEYQRHRFSAAKFIPIIGNIALAARVQYGAIRAASNDPRDNRILVSDRFNPGGTAFDGTIRGYDDGSLTPDSLVTGADTIFYYFDNPDSLVVGTDEPDSILTSQPFKSRVRGKYMLVFNAELQIPISEQQIYGLLFLDAGNSWLHADDIRPFSDLYKGVGVGFRILVPGIGTIGFDFAYPLDDPPSGEEKGWKPHFQIGTTFK